MDKPANASHVLTPDLEAAQATSGMLFHFIAGDRDLRTRLARWIEHHEGDLDEQIVLWYLTACHTLLEPGCTEPMGWNPHPGRTR